MHSVLHSASPQAHVVGTLWWWMLGVAALVYAVVVVAMFAGVLRARRRRPAVDDRGARRWVGGAAFATTCVGGVFLVYSIRVSGALERHPARPMVIEVIGHQWWWEVVYADPASGIRTTAANEIHIPLGQPVAIDLRSADVIHSFWVPSLAGKRDLIPGHPARAWIQADTAGVYRGQCSQFCGLQHAHMAFFVIAERRQDFEAWLGRQRGAAEVPTDSTRARGRSVFVSARCWSCHTIDGTMAVASFGPNLTHVASRSTIAAGTLTTSLDHLAAWIADPASFKPGAQMPSTPLDSADRRALAAYLASLK
jgi:cytochrome c oxidase subunit 2